VQPSIRLGRILGIPIGLHYSWIIIALLITLSLSGHFRGVHSDWTSGVVWTAALVTALLFFASIVAHELSHALMARARGIPVRSITLFALGGVALMERDANSAKTEFWVAIVGPIASYAIGIACLLLASGLGWVPGAEAPTAPSAVLLWLGYINVLLATFNLLPGFPLDGGRVLRAILWGITGNGDRALRLAARAGQVVAFAFIAFGLFGFFAAGQFGGLWLAFIGWFLMEAAQASYLQGAVVEGLRGVRVADVMTADCAMLDSRLTVQAFVDDYLLRTGRRCFMVQDRGRILGLVTPADVKHIERERWAYTPITEAMRPMTELRTIRGDMSAVDALGLMGREDINQLPVVSDGHVEGIITRGHIVQFLQTRSELER
jgi:Zn-dependent protease/CBS domain-containing protein